MNTPIPINMIILLFIITSLITFLEIEWREIADRYDDRRKDQQ